jgi:hypothetical protein
MKLALVAAINNGCLKGFPGLTAQRVNRHIPIKDATKKGHMDQVQQGLQSMQQNINQLDGDHRQYLLQLYSNTKTLLAFVVLRGARLASGRQDGQRRYSTTRPMTLLTSRSLQQG